MRVPPGSTPDEVAALDLALEASGPRPAVQHAPYNATLDPWSPEYRDPRAHAWQGIPRVLDDDQWERWTQDV